MQGKKTYQEKLFACFSLSERIPKDNFYRQLGNVLDLNYLYRLTKPYYGVSGQKSVDPVVFFKPLLVRESFAFPNKLHKPMKGFVPLLCIKVFYYL